MRVLVVDDDDETRELVEKGLARRGHAATTCGTVREALHHCGAARFDVIVLDVMLGTDSGLDVCAQLRALGDGTPVLFLSARGAVRARLEGFESGGDDYLPKPFAMSELLARVQALGRRGPSSRPRVIVCGEAVFDFGGRRLTVAGTEIPITAREWELLRVLASAEGRVVPFNDILARVWGEISPKTQASLEVIVSRLRRKLEPTNPIRTARGVGYALEAET